MKNFIILFLAALSSGPAHSSTTYQLTFSGNICGTNGNSVCTSGSSISQAYGDVANYIDVIYDAKLYPFSNGAFSTDSALQPLSYVPTADGNTPRATDIARGDASDYNLWSEIFLKPNSGISVDFSQIVLAPVSSPMSGNFQILYGLSLLPVTSSYLRQTYGTQTLNYSGANWNSSEGFRIRWSPSSIGIDSIRFGLNGTPTSVTPVSAVPLPGAALLLGSSLLGGAVIRRFRGRKKTIS